MKQNSEIAGIKIGMNHSESLQRYQVILAAKHGIPLTILGIALQTGFNSENFFTESLSAYSAFSF